MHIPIDALGWEFSVQLLDESAFVENPDQGVYVKGTYLEGAGWDKKNSCLVEPLAMQLVSAMPVIHFKPVEQLKKKSRGITMV